MNITLWGVRGSIPTSTPHTKKYGGNTSCVEVESDGWLVILDAGSGIQNLNFRESVNYARIDILLTHLHIDHIQGLGFFQPLFNPETEVHIWGPESNTKSLQARLGRYFSPPLFPVYFRNLTCKLFVHEVQSSTFTIGPFTIQSDYIIHPGPTVGFRVQEGNRVLAYLPDHEPALGRKQLLKDKKWLSGSLLAQDADVLIHDAQYTSEEYSERAGWGHSAMEDALEFASLVEAKHVLLTHHDPMRTDAQLDEITRHLHEQASKPNSFAFAKEGSEVEL
jgi:phosphoribosyl 1,2-cyclic phosphodiesterase